MQSVKLDPYFSSGFTFLGHYYREIKKDNSRAKKCYQKAYVLNPLDTDAALCLSDYFIADNELDEAEAIFRQVSESSPKISWAWRRMGYVNMVRKSKTPHTYKYTDVSINRILILITKPLFVSKRHYVLIQVMFTVGKDLLKHIPEQVDLSLH